ncbi:SMP-30/gluconolactonase/LRE family protein [Herbiconiux sp. UC225_62]|uniref:SMP-30/gluconolactonase/LRE family protein n=1 Tax=Herbiconiux sp. UC225_62 TaxID=3350168 RepID=UPI0036D3AEEF
MRAERITGAVCEHGEGPAVSPRWSGPRFVDMLRGDVLELQPGGELRRRRVGTVAAFLRPRARGGWVVALERAIAVADEDDLDAPLVQGTELWSAAGVRSNDGACSPDGCLHLGTMHVEESPGAGFLMRLTPDGGTAIEVEHATISNGLGFTTDGAGAFYVDSATGCIDRFDWSTRTGLAGRRPWVTRSDGPGSFDGLAVDAEGGVWVAVYGGSAVHRYSPEGRLDEVVDLPVRQPTAVAFDGAALLITTSRHGLGADPEPEAGALFRIDDTGVRGAPVHPFAG